MFRGNCPHKERRLYLEETLTSKERTNTIMNMGTALEIGLNFVEARGFIRGHPSPLYLLPLTRST